MNKITETLQMDHLIMEALREDISSEDVTTNSVMKEAVEGEVELICKQDGVIAGLQVFERVFQLLDGETKAEFFCKDGVLLKDNHIGAAGSVTKAVQMAKEYAPFVRKIEVEVENLDMVKEAVEAGADIIMLDNMSAEEMREAIRIIDGRAETECSGNVTKENIGRLTSLGVDYISSGALTHSAPILDISLKNLHAI